jgi:phage terminase large subunit-like protein
VTSANAAIPTAECECGCKQEVPFGKRFVRGHQLRKSSPARKERGRSADGPLSEITIDGRSVSLIGQTERQKLRLRAQTDLYWLATEILGIPFVERIHRPLTELLVAKDPSKPLAEQSAIKRRAYFLPRASMKTTCAQADALQWILAFPNVRILIFRGQATLARQMLRELKSFFVFNKKLKWLFPEYCADNIKRLGGRDEILTPARTKVLREPTVMIATPESGKVGTHPDILIVDDAVDELNSVTPEQREKTIRAYQMTIPLLEAWGYMTVIGTRYHPNDLYGIILEQAAAHPDKWKVWVQAAWKLKPGAKPDSTSADDYEVWYPEVLSFDVLQQIKSEMEASGHGYLFDCQYLNDPKVTDQVPAFNRALLLNHTLPVTQIPRTGLKIQVWDTAYGSRTKSGTGDFSVCLTGIFCGDRLYVVDCYRERTNVANLAGIIVEQAALHMPEMVGIEAASGVPYIAPLIIQVAEQSRIPFKLDWLTPDRVKGGKAMRITAIASLLSQNLVYFSAAMPHLETMFEELENLGRSRYDDIADALGFLVRYLGHGVARSSLPAIVTEAQRDMTPEWDPLDKGLGPNPCGYYYTG